MLRKLEYGCLVGSIGLIGADRIDLAAGHLPFILTPFLVLAPLVILLHLLRVPPNRLFQLIVTPPVRRQAPFLAAASLFFLFSFASIPLGLDPARGLVAFSDMLTVAILAFYILLRILTEPDQGQLVLRSITFALAVYLIFCVGELIGWKLGFTLDYTRSGPWIESTFAPSQLGNWVPLLSGTTFDPNRSGFILTMYLILIDTFIPKSRYARILRFAIGFLILLTLSRSSTLCWLAYYIFSSTFWSALVSRRAVLKLAGIAVISLLLYGVYQEQINGLLEAWEIGDALAAKLSMDPGSSGESHVLLIRRGFTTWLTSPKTMISGIGFAATPKVVEDFFGTDKHGNFHCLYVTALAEMGLPAFLVLMFLLGYPIIGRDSAVRGMAAVMVFNISYQVHMEAMFWLILALLWSYKRRKGALLRFVGPAPTYPSDGTPCCSLQKGAEKAYPQTQLIVCKETMAWTE
jgi:hypothetical protein